MTRSLIADSIKACTIDIPKEEKKKPSIYQVELRANDTSVFHALFERLCALSNHFHVSYTHADFDTCPLEAGGVAVFYYDDEISAKKLSRNMDIIQESVKSSIVKDLIDVPEPLQALMDAAELGGAYVDRIHVVAGVVSDAADKRAKEMDERKCDDKDEYDTAVEHNLVLLSNEAYTLEDETNAIFATVMDNFKGIDGEAISRLLKTVGIYIESLYTEERIIEEHVALYTDSALELIIDEIGEEDRENEMAAYRIHREARDLLENNKRSTVIRDSWKCYKHSLGLSLNTVFPKAKRKENNSPVSFTGLDTSCTLSPSFVNRLTLNNFNRTVREHEVHQMGALASAIVSQLGSFIEMKRGQVFRAKRHQLAKELIAQYKAKGRLSIMNIANRVLEDTKLVF